MSFTSSRSSLLAWSLLLVSLVVASVQSEAAEPAIGERNVEEHHEVPGTTPVDSVLQSEPTQSSGPKSEEPTGRPTSTRVDLPESDQSRRETTSQYSDMTTIPSSASETSDSASKAETTTTTSPEEVTTQVKECELECLNNGVCRVMPDGSEKCFCKGAFWGVRCQLRDICKSIVVENLTGEEICQRIGRKCIIDDKLFRCECESNEFFVFKADHLKDQNEREKSDDHLRPSGGAASAQELSTFVYDTLISGSVNEHQAAGGADSSRENIRPNYLAECRKVDKCLGVRCRQRSEVCQEGQCECNQSLGFIRDPRDKLCKLLNPCNMPSDKPICGEAKCLPTYNQELYKCVCPIGYYALAPSAESHTIRCALLQYHPTSSIVCLVPLLNKCQHVCQIHNNSYTCACFEGYRAGRRAGVDDHLCFFKDYIGDENEQELEDGLETQGVPPRLRRQITFEPIQWEGEQFERPRAKARSVADETPGESQSEFISAAAAGRKIQSKIIVISEDDTGLRDGRSAHDRQRDSSVLQEESLQDRSPEGGGDLDDTEDNHKFMSAQERCNVYCDENKICVLEDEATGVYRCICDRQGYVSVGDKCLDWCSAAEFSHNVRFLLDMTCATGLCKQRSDVKRPPSNQMSSFYSKASFLNKLSREQQDLVRLVASSSWRPSFQCDCSTSPLVYEDPHSRLCQLNFSAILEPCLPGNEGHTDCVVNKHAYCAVLHRDPLLHSRGLTMGQLMEHMISQAKSGADPSKPPASAPGQKFQHQGAKTSATSGADEAGSSSGAAGGKKAKPVKEKPYVCVCSPEKKFLVDKPRNKARCVDECDLLSNECGRFNRMCRAATVSSNELFGLSKSGLVREDQDGVRMNQFKRTGCECLPGFNVGPSEPRDFTLDSNYPNESDVSSGLNIGEEAAGCSRGCGATSANQRPFRFSWDLLESLLMDANILKNKNPPAGEHSVMQSEFVAVGQDIEHLRTRYMNINSRCLLDYDVVEFHARFKAPADFEPSWLDWSRSGPTEADETSGKVDEKPGPGLSVAADSSNSAHTNQSIGSSPPSDSPNEPDETAAGKRTPRSSSVSEQRHRLMGMEKVLSEKFNADELYVPSIMRTEMADFYKHVVLVADCEFLLGQKSFVAYGQCLRYRYWIVQKFRTHFADWRSVISDKLRETFDLMDGKIRFRVNKCETIIKRVSSVPRAYQHSLDRSRSRKSQEQQVGAKDEEVEIEARHLDPWDHFARVDADLDCKLTIHSASEYDSQGARKTPKRVLLEKQLPKFIFDVNGLNLDIEPNPERRRRPEARQQGAAHSDYYVMAPNALIHRESYDQLAAHRKAFSPCNSEYTYCDRQTRCEMQDVVNYSCTCEAGYTPIGSRDIYFQDSRKEVCEDINECLFDVCKGNGLEDKSVCVNEIGDYKCQCIRHHVGDNKRFCDHICNVIACKHGDCRIPDEHHAFCECYEGYREADCSVQDPSVALRKANMIICSSIFASVLLLAITLAISLNSQLKKTKKKLKRLEAAQEAVEFYEFSLQQPPFRHRVSKASITS